ncbi:hypothetical protein N665_0208s0005 [Sinapis alba]|nr:hypothetical protein N665_0208s0005 [Sinapis alba]
MEEEGEAEPHATINRLVRRIRIPRERATILLVLYDWDEQKFNGEFLLSDEYASIASRFARRPSFTLSTRSCNRCNTVALSQNLGCGHHLCYQCFTELIESPILDGRFLMMCPNYDCGKFLLLDLLRDHMSSEARSKYDISLKMSHQAFFPEPVWNRVVSFVRSSATSLVEIGVQELKAALIERRREICIIAIMAIFQLFD